MNPVINPNGVYCPDQWEDNIKIGVNDHRKPHCSIAIVKLDEDKWIGSSDLQTNIMKCGCFGRSSYPGNTDQIFNSKDECIQYHARDLYDDLIGYKHDGLIEFNHIIDRLEELGNLKVVKQLTLF